jgi:hypothetical protein
MRVYLILFAPTAALDLVFCSDIEWSGTLIAAYRNEHSDLSR